MKNFIPLIAFVAACGTSESGSLLTSGIAADMSVSTTGDGTTNVTAELFDGSPDQLIFVDLQPGDELIATTGDSTMTLVKAQLLTIISYSATFASGSAGDEFTIDFMRTIDGGAPTSSATLPDPFALDPVASTSSRAADLAVTYAPSGTSDGMLLEAEGDCIQIANGASATDSGTITIPAGTLVPIGAGSGSGSGSAGSGSDDSTTCTVTLTITRDRAGTLDSEFGAGGEIQGAQVRTATFSTTP
jgi:hypothetical protein